MKNIAIAILLSLGLSATAQDKNKTEEIKTTTVTVNDGTGKPKKVTKTETVTSNQNIQLKDADSKKLNKEATYTNQEVSRSTTISGDGVPTYYSLNGEQYIFVTDKSGYKIASPNDRNYAVVRKTANGQYIYRTKDSTSIGYFNDNGDFVVETYDDKADGITIQTFTKQKDN
ncbi:hypothetical protein AM493_04380 [Flavobacterium akiainvivens]|uniref:Uncharacterized protein n=1 Tax=Flavobacterium akiainvivens TaxID=1202724 RepID=A0A0M9VHA4_9FLAO|nr:hypothetical protein [Flavobacterium akiainvivens]KOS05352.1 hypothetical protein AM493_04380 [Flavobacterium akiainvivens]SFQ76800.1 hypothetical protein SAMN05444144_12430 [Flavobacterium akiainvivens]